MCWRRYSKNGPGPFLLLFCMPVRFLLLRREAACKCGMFRSEVLCMLLCLRLPFLTSRSKKRPVLMRVKRAGG